MAGAILFLGASSPAFAVEPPSNAVSVAFKEPIGDRFVSVINLVMGTLTLKKRDATHYTFEIGERGDQNDYALFFASLPYVARVRPLPRLNAAERAAPPVTLSLPLTQAPAAAPGNVPGYLIIEPAPNLPPGALSAFVSDQGATVAGTIPGTDAERIALPPGLSVGAAQQRFQSSGLVSAARPDTTVTTPPSGSTAVPPNNFGPGVYVSPNQLLGTHLFVTYAAGGPTPDLIDLVYGTHPLEKTESDEWRLALPPHVNPMVAAHIFRLCPYVTQAEPAYGR
ncbi:MAG TPA: hypothetical protein V6D47_20195 [Oscillatoriaceae cyanobacterium]